MKKALVYGVGSLGLLSLISVVDEQLFFSIVAIVSGLCMLTSAIMLRTMIGVGAETRAGLGAGGSYGQENNKDKRFGVNIGVFALPYIITTILILI